MSVGAVNKQTGDRIPTAGMPAIDSVLSGTSTNPVQNAIITAALALKQNATDNNLQTTDKTVVGAVNELKSGLTNYELQNNINLEVPNRKNLAGNPYNVMLNSNGVFFRASVRTYIVPTSYGKITISVDDITKIADDVIRLGYCDNIPVIDGTGVRISNMETNTYTITPNTTYKYLVVSNLLDDQEGWQDIQIEIGDTATAYTPYIPSVDTRLKSVESGLTSVSDIIEGTITAETGVTITSYSLKKSYHTVTLQALVNFTPTLDTRTLICVLPAGFRPPARMVFAAENDNNMKFARAEVDTYGALAITPKNSDSSEVATNYFVTVTYIV